MAANRVESTPEPAAAGDAAVVKAPAAAGGFKAWLPLIITLVLMPVLAWGMTSFVLLPRLQKGLGITPAEKEHAALDKKGAAAAKKERVSMNKLLVNVAGTLGQRYLLVSLSVEGSGAEFAAKMTESDPPLRAMACGVLSTKTLTDLEKPTSRNLIRTELISGFNNILGEAMIQEIYLTEFAIQ
ncbi:MAG: flagellar basal body-associated FliL family protein [Akkermansiaceae bacterium]|nr:flagellar basal body-associated FliL family protein [Verrucomicrobiales bacterium]